MADKVEDNVMHRWFVFLSFMFGVTALEGGEPLRVWPQVAPGETTQQVGEPLPPRAGESPPITRVVNVTQPTMTVHLAPQPNGTAVVILPGGGFSRVVPDLEGTEAADWLNR